MDDRLDNKYLLGAGLELMRKNGKPLTKQPGFGTSMRYAMPNGKTVRVRTCNDHVLIVIGDSPDPDEAKLNIEGTDWLLIVMPEIERTAGKVLAYLVPTSVAAKAVRDCHRDWLKSNPKTKGNNTTFNIWFDEGGKSAGFAARWHEYLLPGDANVTESFRSDPVTPTGSLKDEVESARQRIAKAAGVSTSAVKITVEYGA